MKKGLQVALYGLWVVNVWADEMPTLFNASYIIKVDQAQPVGLMANYIDKPQWDAHSNQALASQAQSQYTSLGFGPSVEVNDKVTAYSVIGAAAITDTSRHQSAPIQALSLDSDARMYGFGMNIRPNEQWHIDIQYQNSQLYLQKNDAKQVNYFNLGVGYRF